MIVAISGTVQPATARRVTAVPRRSCNVSPTMPAAAPALRQLDQNPSAVQGFRAVLVKITVLRFGVTSSMVLSGVPTGMTTRAPVFDWRSRM